MLLSFKTLFVAAAACTLPFQAAASVLPSPFQQNNTLLPRADADGTLSGKDPDGIFYVKDFINAYTSKVPDEDRVGIFWAGGATTADDFENIYEFIEMRLDFKGKLFSDVFDFNFFQTNMNLGTEQNNLYWRAMYRASKALAAAATNGKAYVYMNNNNCRTLFSPPSQHPQDVDPDHGGQATNGEIFYYAELPTLMRNPNIDQIITFSKVNRKFVVNVAWDVNRDTDKPRDYLPEISMDAVPIVLPPEAGRPPMKRSTSTTGKAW
ncbi:hypothetical protein VTN96DRAFT_4469 [Rasamsonia emersonii]